MDKKTIVRWVVVAVAVFVAYTAHVQINTYLGKKALRNTGLEVLSLEQAFLASRSNGKPVLADLSAIWCPSCRKLDQNVLADPAVKQAIAQGYVYARIEYESEEGKAFQKRYEVSGFPNLLVLDSDGTLVRKLALSFEPGTFLKQL